MTASWVEIPAGSDFPLENLPYGVFDAGSGRRIGVAIGDQVLDLYALVEEGLLPHGTPLQDVDLNAFLGMGPQVWHEVRLRLLELLTEGNTEIAATGVDVLHLQVAVAMSLPFAPGDYVDFYSSLGHATNLGKLFRPDSEPLLPNWRHNFPRLVA